MAEKIFNVRIVQKHNTEAEWLKAVDFIPKQGEIIIYDKDNNYSYERIKIGDGATKVSSLPFVHGAVESVNGQTGVINLTAKDINALPADTIIPSVEGLATETYVNNQVSSLNTKINEKINVSDIVNNVTNSSTKKPLSAAQGKYLNDRINSITDNLENLGGGDMMQATYDVNGDGIVDNAERLGGQLPEYYAPAANYVKKSGDTMTDRLVIEKSSYPSVRLDDTSTGSDVAVQNYGQAAVIDIFNIKGNQNKRRSIVLRSSDATAADLKNAIYLRDVGNSTDKIYDIYGEHNIEASMEELGYVKGVTSSIQSQLNNKFPKLGINPLTTIIGTDAADTVANWAIIGTGCGVLGANDRNKITNCPVSGNTAWIFNLVYDNSAVYQLYMPYGKNSTLYHRGGNLDASWYNDGQWSTIYDSNTIVPIVNGGTGASTADDALSNLGIKKNKMNIYNSITDIGLTASATFADTVAAVPNYTILYLAASSLTDASWNLQEDYGTIQIIKREGAQQITITHCGRTSNIYSATTTAAGIPTGAWNRIVEQNSLDTALENKQDKITGAASSIVSSDFSNVDAVLISNSNGKVSSSSGVTATQLKTLQGINSNIQDQLNNKLDNNGDQTINGGSLKLLSTDNEALRIEKIIDENNYNRLYSILGESNARFGFSVNGEVTNQLTLGKTETTLTKPLNIASGGTGVSSLEDLKNLINDFKILGTNPIDKTENDTLAKWQELGSGFAYFNATNKLINQPAQYGTVVSFVNGSFIFQMFSVNSATGHIYTRYGNSSGWRYNWKKIPDQNDFNFDPDTATLNISL